jgi:hypothetical protein
MVCWRKLWRATLAALIGLSAAPHATAGSFYAYGGSPYPGYPVTAWPYADPYGSFLQGAAAAIDAQGRFVMDEQRARLRQQQAEQAKLDTQRRQLELWSWRRQHLPGLADALERSRHEQVRLAQLNPPVTEVLSGKALNDLLADCQILQGRGAVGPEVRLDGAALRRVNVVSGAAAGGAGLLRSSRLDWPALLTRQPFNAERERVEALLAEAKGQAATGPVQGRTLQELDDALARLEEQVKDLNKSTPDADLKPSDCVRARRFLCQLRDARRLLQEPDAGAYLRGTYAARGETAAELAQLMTRQGLRFAPAAGGDEAGYLALHRALAAYDAGLQAAAGVTLPDRAARPASIRQSLSWLHRRLTQSVVFSPLIPCNLVQHLVAGAVSVRMAGALFSPPSSGEGR